MQSVLERFPNMPEAERRQRLEPPAERSRTPLRMVLDTDTYNEIDDQFAVVHALLSPERLAVEALYAAPFHNDRSTGPADGMRKSYEEILRLLERLGVAPEGFVFKGSTAFLPDWGHACRSEAADDLVRRAMEPAEQPLYVVAIGAPTNVASALLLEPAIMRRIVVVWLGGQPFHWHTAREFNLAQDPWASRLLFDCGVPLVHIPCMGVASQLLTTVPEVERHLAGTGPIGAYLLDIFKAYHADHFAWSKPIWDLAPIGYLLWPDSVPTTLAPSPILTGEITYAEDPARHAVRVATFVHRDPIFRDLFTKLARRRG